MLAKHQFSQLTLTISPSHGPYLISFLALFVGIVGNHLWGIICFILHQSLSTSDDRDGLHHQFQVLLRNSSNGASFLWMMAKLAITWRRRARHVKRTWLLSVPATAYVAVIALAAVFSSVVTLAGDEVLARGSACGWMGLEDTSLSNLTTSEASDDAIVGWSVGRWQALKALEYSKACYDINSLGTSSACKLYTTPTISTTVDKQVPCPFGGDICGLPHGITVDTGLIDSSAQLGINSPSSSRLKFRKVLSCVPTMAEERYSSGWEPLLSGRDDIVFSGDRFKYYYLGGIGASNNLTWGLSNYTRFLKGPGYHLS